MIMRCLMAEQALEAMMNLVVMEKIVKVMELTLLVYLLVTQQELLMVLMFTGNH